MIEFTISRVVMCACGVILLISVTGVLDGIYDLDRSDEDERLVLRIGYMLDAFESSDVDELFLDGASILPEGYGLKVRGGFVELYSESDRHISMTSYSSEFELSYGEVLRITHRTSLRFF
ncbi:MAG: hypothetical protein E7Z65_00570 [Thermoplasmata archaeon]|nr:hypothetical protein [Thermoplasmata archaeon]